MPIAQPVTATMTILFFSASRRFIEGMMAGAVKG
jgi:hypothetical protein